MEVCTSESALRAEFRTSSKIAARKKPHKYFCYRSADKVLMNEQQFQNKTSHEVQHQASFPIIESMQVFP